MIRDDRFQSNFEPEDDSLWFPSQLLHTFSSIQSQSDDIQVDMLKVSCENPTQDKFDGVGVIYCNYNSKVLLYVACSTYWTVNGRIIIQILTVCSEVYENGTVAIRSASQAASSQILCAFCHFLGNCLLLHFIFYICVWYQLIMAYFHIDEECLEVDSNKSSNSAGILCFNEAIPILQFICCKVDETQRYAYHFRALLSFV